MTYAAFHSVRDATFHIFRYGRSHLHAATLDRTGAILPPQAFEGAWRPAWDSEYHEGDVVRGFDARQALTNIEADGYHLFEFRPARGVGQAAGTPADAKAVEKLLKPVDRLLIDLKKALEHYNAAEKRPELKAENGALLKKAEAMSHRLEELVL
jgi:hypothetical protein